MSVSEDLVERLSSETGRRLLGKAREGRRQALARLDRVAVTVTLDGSAIWTEMFDAPPTLGQLLARLGPAPYIVSVRRCRRSVRERIREALAA